MAWKYPVATKNLFALVGKMPPPATSMAPLWEPPVLIVCYKNLPYFLTLPNFKAKPAHRIPHWSAAWAGP